MEFQEALSKLTNSVHFKDWIGEHKDSYLAHGFKMMDEANEKTWQIGFYDSRTNKIKTFIVGEEIQHVTEQEMLDKEKKVEKLNPADVKIGYERALENAEHKFKETKEFPLKKFFLVQVIDGKAVYNITYFTQSFNTVNYHVDAGNGDVLKETKQKLAGYAK